MSLQDGVINILAIDDDREVLEGFKMLFGQGETQLPEELSEFLSKVTSEEEAEQSLHQFALDVVDNGKQGAAMAGEKPYRVVLLDMRMPNGWDGLRTAIEIGKLNPEARIILISAYMDHALTELGEKLGHNFAYLQKPYNRDELVQLVLLLSNDWQREQQLIQAKEELQRVSQAKDEFLASMSHELRTPLTSIIGNSEYLARVESDPEKQQLIRSIETAGRNQLALVSDILDMSKIEAGKFTVDQYPYNLSSLLHDIEHMFSSRAEEAGLELVINPGSDEAYLLMGDEHRIGQILVNLIGNGIKFTEQGQVTLTTRVDGRYLIFQVEDSGIGMAPERIDKLFTRFEQADGAISRRFGGSGLGLYISENLSNLMGGWIDVSSKEGVGSIFQLVLPYIRSDLPVKSREEKSKSDTQAPGGALTGHVLIAEDTPELQLLERRILEKMGLTVSIANNGEEAVELATTQPFDLLLMDMQMPVMDGIEATRLLREKGVPIPIVALTANVLQKHRDAFDEAGCNGFLCKPIVLDQLKEELNKHLIRAVTEPIDESSQPVKPVETVSMADEELMKLFFDRMGELKLSLSIALSNEDWDEVREIAHVIKGSAASFGYPKLTQSGAMVCDVYEQGDLDKQPELVMDLLFKTSSMLH